MYYVLFTWVKGRKERDFQGFRTKPELIEFLGKNFEKIVVWNIHHATTNYRFGLVEKESKSEDEHEPTLEEALKKVAERRALNIPDEAILEPEDEEKPADYLGSLKPEGKQHPFVKNKKEEPSAMEKIADQIDEEKKEDLTDAEILKKNKEALENIEEKEEEVDPFETDEEKDKRIVEKADKLIRRETEKGLEKTTGFIPKPVVESIKSGYKRKKDLKDRRADWPKCPECKIRPMAPWNTKRKCSVCQRPKGKRPYVRKN